MEEDKLKKLMQEFGLEEPGEGFADQVMKMVQEEELNLAPALLPFIKNELVAEPTVQFSDNLMANIQPALKKMPSPILTKRVGFMVCGIGILLFFLMIIFPHSNPGKPHNDSYFSRFSSNITGTTVALTKNASPVLIYLIPLSMLLSLDYFFRTRRRELTSAG